MRTVIFENKFSALRYYSKAKDNNKLVFLAISLNAKIGKWQVMYCYK